MGGGLDGKGLPRLSHVDQQSAWLATDDCDQHARYQSDAMAP
jgi:hypothetical protein